MSEIVNVDNFVRAETASVFDLYRPRPTVLERSWVPRKAGTGLMSFRK